ncbi:MAG: hypothetical protein IJY39_01020 [Clostridia bacterium]|nr:hypothetical protein [Clostridia bacterium]
MKKIIAIILASLMLLTFVACDNGSNDETTTNAPEITTEAENVTTEAPAPTEEEYAAAASVETIAQALINKYAEFTGLKDTYDQYMAEMPEEEQISYEEFCSYQLSCAPVDLTAEEIWLMGFSETPTGFSEAYCYQPMMMGQAFIGYVFRVAEGTDVEAFKSTLTSTCDPRWNICTMANTTVCESYGDLVYFSMMVVADEENPYGFTAEQKDAFYSTFVETIESSIQ